MASRSKSTVVKSRDTNVSIAVPDKAGYDFSFNIAVVGPCGVGKTALVSKETAKSTLYEADDKLISNPFGITFKDKIYHLLGYHHLVTYWDCPGSERYARQTKKIAAGAAAAIFVFDLTDAESLKRMEDWIISFDSWKGNGPNNEDESNENVKNNRFSRRYDDDNDDDGDEDDGDEDRPRDRFNRDDDDDDDDDDNSDNNRNRLGRLVGFGDSNSDSIGGEADRMPRIVIANKLDCKDDRKVEMDKALRVCDRYGLDYYECSAITGEGLYEAFAAIAMSVARKIPDPPEASALFDAKIRLSYDMVRRENHAYRRALFSPLQLQDPSAVTQVVDWL